MRIRYSFLRRAFLLLLLGRQGLLAAAIEEDELALAYGDKLTTSIATGGQQLLRRAPALATVFTAEDIAATGATDLDQLLESVPGLHVSVTADGYSPIYVFRGIYQGLNNPQVLMLQNGIPLTISYAGDRGRYSNGFPLENVARIEIIRGPGSALYGADAYSGVINIITKTAGDAGTQAGLLGGSFNSRDAWLRQAGKLGPLNLAAYARVGGTDGYKRTVTADNATRLNQIFNNASSLAPGPVNVGRDEMDAQLELSYDLWRLRSSYKLRENQGTGAGISSALDPTGKNDSARLTADLSWNNPQLAEGWQAGMTAAYLHYREHGEYRLFPAGTIFPTGTFPNGMLGNPDRYERQLRLSSFAAYSGMADQVLRIGLGHEDLNLYRAETHKNYILNAAGLPIPTGPVIDYNAIQPHITPHRRQLDYLYMQDEWSFARDWTLTGGIRHDSYSDFGGTTNPRLALVWDASLNLTAKLLYGRAYRAPSFNDQYGTNPVGSGNADILPETIDTVEAAIAWQPQTNTQVNLNIFHYQMRDIIRPVPNAAPSPGTTLANVGAQHGSGVELEVVWDAARNLRLAGNYAYQRSIDETTHADAGYAPHHHLYARADWHFASAWFLNGQVNRVAGRKRAFGDSRPDIANYTTLDMALRTHQSASQWEFSVSLRNAFNADVREPSLAPGVALPYDLPMAPRSLWLQAVYTM